MTLNHMSKIFNLITCDSTKCAFALMLDFNADTSIVGNKRNKKSNLHKNKLQITFCS